MKNVTRMKFILRKKCVLAVTEEIPVGCLHNSITSCINMSCTPYFLTIRSHRTIISVCQSGTTYNIRSSCGILIRL